jgi:anti-sigma B factor antagonist
VPQFTVDTWSDAHGRHVVAPRGELDVATHRYLREAIHELVLAGKVDIVVDLNHTTFLDSTALGTLISARRRTHALKGSFAILCDDERLLQVFRVTSLDRVFTIISSS